jgi:hypothetical protein
LREEVVSVNGWNRNPAAAGRKEQRPFSAAGRLVTHSVRCSPMRPGAQVEALARKRPEIVMAALRVRTANPSDTIQVVSAGCKLSSDLLHTIEPKPAIGGCVLVVVWIAQSRRSAVQRSCEVRCVHVVRSDLRAFPGPEEMLVPHTTKRQGRGACIRAGRKLGCCSELGAIRKAAPGPPHSFPCSVSCALSRPTPS